jgi:hypothetical protein
MVPDIMEYIIRCGKEQVPLVFEPGKAEFCSIVVIFQYEHSVLQVTAPLLERSFR